MKNYSLLLVFMVLVVSCVEDFDHKAIDGRIEPVSLENKTEITFQQLFNLHNRTIGKDTIVTGYVVSSDLEGNFYKELFLQNSFENDTEDNPILGLRVRVGMTSVNTHYALGRKIAINLEGLKKTTTGDVLTVGASEGTYLKDILEFDVDKHLLKLDELVQVKSKEVQITDLSTQHLNTLVKLKNVHFKKEDIGKPLAGLPTDDFDGKRTLEYCDVFSQPVLTLETSNFSDFSDEIIPNKQLDVTGVYTLNFDKEPVLVMNSVEDLVTVAAYETCIENMPQILITEVADPKESSKARFVELYNASLSSVPLNGWSLVRYNYTASKPTKELAAINIPLNGIVLKPNTAVVVARDLDSFQTYFGQNPDLVSSKLDGNGDDAYELLNPSKDVVDVYGFSTMDGSDAVWEYTDGVAKRKVNIQNQNSLYTSSEWIVEVGVVGKASYSPGVR